MGARCNASLRAAGSPEELSTPSPAYGGQPMAACLPSHTVHFHLGLITEALPYSTVPAPLLARLHTRCCFFLSLASSPSTLTPPLASRTHPSRVLYTESTGARDGCLPQPLWQPVMLHHLPGAKHPGHSLFSYEWECGQLPQRDGWSLDLLSQRT